MNLYSTRVADVSSAASSTAALATLWFLIQRGQAFVGKSIVFPQKLVDLFSKSLESIFITGTTPCSSDKAR